jgi:23S rRNA pseudouridine2605 synthase
LTHPRYGIAKTYVVRIKGEIKPEQIEKLKKGIWLSEGKTSRASVKILKRRHTESSIEITIRQGLNRQVRRMLAKIGLPVKSLTRIKVGRLGIRGLGVGKSRELTNPEVTYLKKVTAD